MKSHRYILLTILFSIVGSFIYAQPKKKTEDISISRNVSATRYNQDGEPMVIITLIINKNTTRGNAGIEEDFSTDMQATVVKSDNAVFESKDGKATFQWANIPMDKEVTVSYQLQPINNTKDDQAVFGQFSYQNHIYTITPSSFSLKVVSGEKKPPPSLKKDPPFTKEPAPAKINPVKVNPTPKQGALIYRIQIAAVGDKSQADDILQKYKITE